MQDINRPVRASVLPDREVPHDFRGGHALLIALHRRGMGASHDKLLLVEALSCPAAQRSLSYGKQYRRSEEHTSELQSLMRISYADFCLKKNRTKTQQTQKKIQSKLILI